MVQLVNSSSGKRGPEEYTCRVKLEIDDPLYEEHGVKRFKHWSSGCSSSLPAQPAHYNPLEEPSPLGLRLRKSPSLLDLIQMRLSQGFSCPQSGLANKENPDATKKKDGKAGVAADSNDKLKASNFPASLLRIGSWECVSRYEGDLVAKCYFAKHKLVWEVLDGPLKCKIEIQWSDITAIKATCPDDEPGTVDIVLARQPLFFRETNPQPRKHTLWQATSDFTGGQASINRRHFLQCPQGLLNKHFEKLIQCDPRLNLLSRQPEIVLDSPYFETRCPVFDEPEDLKSHCFDQIKKEYVSPFSVFPDTASSCAAQLTSVVPNIQEKAISKETLPLSSDSRDVDVNEGISPEDLKVAAATSWDQLKVPGLRPSMSMTDLMNHIEQCISEQNTSGNPFSILEGEGHCSKDMLEDISQYLLSDSQLPSASDEQSLMSRVNSLCCLLQKDSATVQNLQIKTDDGNEQTDFMSKSTDGEKGIGGELASDDCANDGLGCKQRPAMSRKDSLGDLLLHLPRIASLPQFLFNIPEDGDNQAR